MIERVQIPFDPSFKVDPDAPTVRPAWLVDEAGLVYVRCACGWIIGSPRLHSIDEDGSVNASLMHGERGCPWHVWGRFENWTHGALAAGAPKFVKK